MKWVPVKDELPPPGELVLLWSDSRAIPGGFASTRTFVPMQKKHLRAYLRGARVTHWARIEGPTLNPKKGAGKS